MTKSKGIREPVNTRPRWCDHCRQLFVAPRTTARYCSDRCRLYAWRDRKRQGERTSPETAPAAATVEDGRLIDVL